MLVLSRARGALVLLLLAHSWPLVAVLDAWEVGVAQTGRTEETGETETPNRDTKQRQTETDRDRQRQTETDIDRQRRTWTHGDHQRLLGLV